MMEFKRPFIHLLCVNKYGELEVWDNGYDFDCTDNYCWRFYWWREYKKEHWKRFLKSPLELGREILDVWVE